MVFGVTAQTAVQCEMKPWMLRIATRFLLTDLPTPRQIFATVRGILWPLRGAHPEKVFTYATKERPCPIALPGLDTAFGRAIVKSGIVRFPLPRANGPFRCISAPSLCDALLNLRLHNLFEIRDRFDHKRDVQRPSGGRRVSCSG